MTEQEIREQLEEYHKTKAVNNIHWIARELEHQLDRNTAMLSLLERWVKAFADEWRPALKGLFDDTKTLLGEAKEE